MNSTLVNGYRWSFINVAIKTLVQIIYTSIISRLLDVKSFGIIAMATLVINFGGYFAKLGLGPAIIQKKEICDGEKNAAFTASIILGNIAAIVIFLSAPFVAMFFKEYKLVNIVRVLSISFIINSVSIVPISLLSKSIRFKAISVIEILAYIMGNLIVGITFAINGMGEWSLVFATLSQQLIISTLSLIILNYKFKFTFNKEYYMKLYSYGTKSTINNILDYFIGNTEKLFIGKMDSIILGQYNRIISVIVTPIEQILSSLSRVFFPHISKFQDDKIELKKEYIKYYMLFSTILLSIGFGAILASNNIIKIILGSKWLGIEKIFSIIVIATIINSITHFNAVLCDAIAKLKSKFIIQLVSLGLILILSFLFAAKGAILILFIMMISKIIIFIMYQINTKEILGLKLNELVELYFNILRSSIVVPILIKFITIIMNLLTINSLIILIMQILAGIFGLIIGILILPIKEIRCKLIKSNYKIKMNKYGE